MFEGALAFRLLYFRVYHALQNSQQAMDDKSFRLSARGCIDKGNVVLGSYAFPRTFWWHPLLEVAKDNVSFVRKGTLLNTHSHFMYLKVLVRPDWSKTGAK